MTTLLACIDASRYAESVCDHAAWAAARLGASVELLHVLDRHEIDPAKSDLSGTLGFGGQEALLEELAALDEQRGRLARRQGQALLEEATTRLRTSGVSEIHAHQRHGTLVDTIAELEPSVDLIVIGRQGAASGTSQTHLGANLERVVRSTHTPMLVTARAYRPIERVLLAFDGSHSSRKAVSYVVHSPLLAGAACRLVTVGADEPDVRKQLDDAAALLRGAGFDATTDVLPGHAEQVIAAEVEAGGVELLVMGAHGHSRIRTLVIGSTTTALLRSCPASVLMIR